MKKVKTKPKRRFKKRILLYAFCVFLGYQLSYNLIMNFKLADSNETFIKGLLADSNYHMLYEKKANNLFSRLFSEVIDVNKPVSILENTFHFKASKTEATTYIDSSKVEMEEADNPSIYIYNSHQSEEYQGEGLEEYNIKPGVMMAAYILEDKLEKEGVNTMILEDNLIDYMNLNNMSFNKSYIASRTLIEDVISSNNFKLIIDLHRDSIAKDKVTTVINNKSCAKVVFVNGLDYETSDQNLSVANKLNDKIKEKYPSLTRGVLTKGGDDVNGIYNQDLNPNMILLELGSQYSTIDEVLNTLELLAPILKEYVNEI